MPSEMSVHDQPGPSSVRAVCADDELSEYERMRLKNIKDIYEQVRMYSVYILFERQSFSFKARFAAARFSIYIVVSSYFDYALGAYELDDVKRKTTRGCVKHGLNNKTRTCCIKCNMVFVLLMYRIDYSLNVL